MPTTLADAARETFAGCAAFYDALTAHHDYWDLTNTLERLIAEHGDPGTRLLDVACGTGKSFLEFARRGYSVTACDLSAEMLARARAKADGRAELFVADMRELPRVGEFDVVTCIDEPLNYLLAADELECAIRSIATNVRPGGLFVFDLNTLHAFRTLFARDECYEQEGWLFVWRGHGDGATEPGGRSAFTIDAFTEVATDHWIRRTNQHLQRHHPAELVVDLLAVAGLDCVGLYGMTPDGRLHRIPDEERQTKLFYVARKPTPERRR
jgi:SAM-dependent methyltransferase